MERIRSGNPELDRILSGGFPANAIHLVLGTPGSGKTILTEQLAFANATPERPALYIVTVSEPLAKFIGFLQEYGFADASRVGTDVIYVALGDKLAAEPEQLCSLVMDLVQRHRPGVVVIDSLKAVGELMPNRAAWRRQLHELAGFLSAYRTTSFWVGEYAAATASDLPEVAVVDGVVELSREQQGSRDFRFIRVVKLRGSDFLDGYHAFRITRQGLLVSPRLRTAQVSPDYHAIDERLGTGIPGVDEMIATGWLRGTTMVVAGPSGAGKSVLALQFLEAGVERGEPALLVSLEENPVQLARVVQHLGWDAKTLLVPGKIDVFFCSPVELQIDTIVGELFARIDRDGVRRVVIDGAAELASTASDPVRYRDYLFTVAQQFAARNIAALLTLETVDGAPQAKDSSIFYLADNVLLLEMHLEDELRRTIRVLKTRGSAHDARRRTLTIGRGGIVVR